MADQLPAFPRVIRAVKAAFVIIGLHNGEYAIRVGGRWGHADLANKIRKAFFKLFPAFAAIDGFINAAAAFTAT